MRKSNFIQETISLAKKDLLTEWRQRYALGGILLYVFSTIFISYYAIGRRLGDTEMIANGPMIRMQKAADDLSGWSALFWIVILFASVNAIAKSFVQENSNRRLYYYQICSAESVLISKFIYNSILLAFLSLLSYAGFTFVLGNSIRHQGLFFLILLLSSIGLAITFTFISAIAVKAKNSSTMMAILSFPVVLPVLLTLLRLTKYAQGILQDNAYLNDILILCALDVILGAVAVLLFPFLWRE